MNKNLPYFSANNFSIQVFACLYAYIDAWNISSLLAPFWRVYVPLGAGGIIIFQNREYKLKPMIPVIIPPYTDYSSKLVHEYSKMYCHFKLISNIQFKPGIYEFKLPDHIAAALKQIRSQSLADPAVVLNLAMLECLSHGINHILPLRSEKLSLNKRTEDVIKIMQNNMEKPMTNHYLSKAVRMAENSFVRDFKTQTGLAPQKYYMQLRLEYACNLLANSVLSIEEISEMCGFWDRNHFTKFFTRQWSCPPAEFRKRNKILG